MSVESFHLIEGIAARDPQLYEILRTFADTLRHQQTFLQSGMDEPENVVAAAPSALYFQRTKAGNNYSVWIKTGYPGTKKGWMLLHTQPVTGEQDYPNLSVDPSKSGFRALGSVPPQGSTGFAYASTTTSITWYWDGTNGSSKLTLYRADGTTVTGISGSLAVTGLQAGATYYFYPYYDETLKKVDFVVIPNVGHGTPAAAYLANLIAPAQQQSLRSRTPLSNGSMTAATTSGGQGSGSGGGAQPWPYCFHGDMKFLRTDGRLVQATDLRTGDMLRGKHGATLVWVRGFVAAKEWVRIRFRNAAEHIVTPRHGVWLRDGTFIAAEDVHPGMEAERDGDKGVIIDAVERLRETGIAVDIKCQPEALIYAGMERPTVLAHNVYKL